MSSFIGHSLTAVTIYAATRPKEPLTRRDAGWAVWLIVVANVPDVDYAISILSASHHGVRLTHSIGGALFLPLLTVIFLLLQGMGGRELGQHTLQLVLAGVSHIFLDGLVGVTFLPLLWPIYLHQYRLSFGLLPSAGRPSLTNPYFYHNLLIEMGVIIPLYYAILLTRYATPSRQRMLTTFVLLFCSAGFMYWAFTLAR